MPKYGDVREDGYIFEAMHPLRRGRRYEHWLSPKAWRRKMINNSKRNAKVRGLSWELTDDRALWLINQPCVYCGAEPLNGIDRVKNEYGYTLMNSVPCCPIHNSMKSNLDIKRFFLALAAIQYKDYLAFKIAWEGIRASGPQEKK